MPKRGKKTAAESTSEANKTHASPPDSSQAAAKQASSNPAQIFLGIDYGRRYIGLAVGQTITCSARCLEVIPAQHGLASWSHIEKLLHEWSIEAIVVGLPLNMDGSTQEITLQTMAFVEWLQQQTKLPVYTVDERLTTVEAKQQLSTGKKHKLASQRVDSYAAKLILEAWFQEQKHGA